MSPGLTRSAPVRATYDPGRRPTAMAYEVSTTIEIAATVLVAAGIVLLNVS